MRHQKRMYILYTLLSMSATYLQISHYAAVEERQVWVCVHSLPSSIIESGRNRDEKLIIVGYMIRTIIYKYMYVDTRITNSFDLDSRERTGLERDK